MCGSDNTELRGPLGKIDILVVNSCMPVCMDDIVVQRTKFAALNSPASGPESFSDSGADSGEHRDRLSTFKKLPSAAHQKQKNVPDVSEDAVMDLPVVQPKFQSPAISGYAAAAVAGAVIGGAVVFCATNASKNAPKLKESDNYLLQTVDVWHKWLKDYQKPIPGQQYSSNPPLNNLAPEYSPKHQPGAANAVPSSGQPSPHSSRATAPQQQLTQQQLQQEQLQKQKLHHQQQHEQDEHQKKQTGRGQVAESVFFGPSKLAELEDDEILSEALTRNVQFFGLPGQKAIGASFVVVVGLGVSGVTIVDVNQSIGVF